MGWREDIPEILAITDVFVMTSLWEGLPRSLVEALSLKIPSVCYETDGVTDLLSRGGGKIIPQKRPDLAAEAISEILSDSVSKSIYFDNFPYQILSEFDINFMVKQQEEMYDHLLHENHAN